MDITFFWPRQLPKKHGASAEIRFIVLFELFGQMATTDRALDVYETYCRSI